MVLRLNVLDNNNKDAILVTSEKKNELENLDEFHATNNNDDDDDDDKIPGVIKANIQKIKNQEDEYDSNDDSDNNNEMPGLQARVPGDSNDDNDNNNKIPGLRA